MVSLLSSPVSRRPCDDDSANEADDVLKSDDDDVEVEDKEDDDGYPRMNCPACDATLFPVKAGDITVDVCASGCGGAWFDDREIKRFDEPHEFKAEMVFIAPPGAPRAKRLTARPCPTCSDQILCRRYFDPKAEVEVDQCLKCSGIWLDTGELRTIRSQYRTEAERMHAADKYIQSVLAVAKANLVEVHKQRLAEIEGLAKNPETAAASMVSDAVGGSLLENFEVGFQAVVRALAK